MFLKGGQKQENPEEPYNDRKKMHGNTSLQCFYTGEKINYIKNELLNPMQ